LEFPATINSLLEPDTKNGGIDKSTQELYKLAIWKRADKIFKASELTVLPKEGPIKQNSIR
jgi:hypothetical protein